MSTTVPQFTPRDALRFAITQPRRERDDSVSSPARSKRCLVAHLALCTGTKITYSVQSETPTGSSLWGAVADSYGLPWELVVNLWAHTLHKGRLWAYRQIFRQVIREYQGKT